MKRKADVMSKTPEKKRSDANKFADAAHQSQVGIVREFWDFLLHNKKWWITPIVVVLLLVGLLVMLSGSAVAPFIYTIF